MAGGHYRHHPDCDAMNIEIIAILFIGALGGWAFASLHNKERRIIEQQHTIEKQDQIIEKLQSCTKLGYNDLQAYDELIAYLVGIEKRSQIAREFAIAAKRGKYRKQKDE